ncbi:hypothetical protein [Marisediminicola sp. LYQ134]|uniref:hypothetical protein n=1 Tax=unclassified Marisediminicola TaxID=2618316 RepID=UPI003982F786
MTGSRPELPAAGEKYRVCLFGGPLDGKTGTVVSEGGLNASIEFEVDEVRARYVSTGGGSHGGGKSAWSYNFSPDE